MKKIYIKPVVEVDFLETSDILAGSPHVTTNNFDGTNIPNDNSGINGTVTEGPGEDEPDNFGAKSLNSWFANDDFFL